MEDAIAEKKKLRQNRRSHSSATSLTEIEAEDRERNRRKICKAGLHPLKIVITDVSEQNAVSIGFADIEGPSAARSDQVTRMVALTRRSI
nr:hypothetical protein Iba_chr14bCG8390 [Ipomoea batatas]